MSESIAESLVDHFNRAWDMIVDAAQRFPETEWQKAFEERAQPARIVYHVLMGADRYTWLGVPDDYVSKRRFALDWMKTPVQEFPLQQEAIRHLREAQARTMEWIRHFGPEGLVEAKPMWPWTGSCALAQGLYHLRHLQHHMAELNVELRRRGLDIGDWK